MQTSTIAFINPYKDFYFNYAPIPRHAPNTKSQATVRREIRRRSNAPRAIQKRLNFKQH